MYGRLGTVLPLFVALTLAQAQKPVDITERYGAFVGTLNLEPLPDGIHMKVLARYSYTDSERHTLVANPGFTTDGASIPRELWTIVGSPFTGKYVGAAVIHDVGCDSHKYSWQTTHRMFYDAMMAEGVSENYAKLLYWGVRLGGPKWQEEEVFADTLPKLKERIEASKGTQSGDITKIDNAGGTHHKGNFKVRVQIPIPSGKPLTDKEVQDFMAHIEARAETKEGAISLDEIDTLTPLTDGLGPKSP
jgi:Protein of unknown function (DUF1353)